MPKGHSDIILKTRKLTSTKIVATLSVEPFRFNQLHEQTKIQRKRLKDRLRELTFQNIIFEHTFCIPDDPAIEYNSKYYLLNWSNPEARELVEYWFASEDPQIEDIDMLIQSNSSRFIGMIQQRLDMMRNFSKMDKSKLSEKEFKKEFGLYAKNKRILEKIAICDCKVKPSFDFYSESMTSYDDIFQIISGLYIRGYSGKDTMIKCCADYKTPFLMQYCALWNFYMKNRQNLLAFAERINQIRNKK